MIEWIQRQIDMVRWRHTRAMYAYDADKMRQLECDEKMFISLRGIVKEAEALRRWLKNEIELTVVKESEYKGRATHHQARQQRDIRATLQRVQRELERQKDDTAL